MNDHEVMIISALRYALNRQSYIMSCTDEYITRMLKGKVSLNFLACCKKDIEEHYEEAKRLKYDMKGQYDWYPLLGRLEMSTKSKIK